MIQEKPKEVLFHFSFAEMRTDESSFAGSNEGESNLNKFPLPIDLIPERSLGAAPKQNVCQFGEGSSQV